MSAIAVYSWERDYGASYKSILALVAQAPPQPAQLRSLLAH